MHCFATLCNEVVWDIGARPYLHNFRICRFGLILLVPRLPHNGLDLRVQAQSC
jgi:hypothetical protein